MVATCFTSKFPGLAIFHCYTPLAIIITGCIHPLMGSSRVNMQDN
jgi:hypothetical protein